MIKKFLYLFIIYNLLINYSFSQTSFDSQKVLIKNNIIYEGISCDELTKLLGGTRQVSTLWLEGKQGQKREYVLVNSDNKSEFKMFYVCKKFRNNNENTDKLIKAMRDQDLEKIFEDPVELFAYIFTITSQSTSKYILSRLSKEDFNIDHEGMSLALQKSVREKVSEKKQAKKVEKKQTKKVEKTTKVKQEEVKQVVTKVDEKSPTIIIQENITVNDTSYTISGKIEDEGSDILYVKVDNDIFAAENGKFSIKRFSPIDEKVSIVGIDQWGNESKPKIVNVTVSLDETLIVDKIDKLNPSKLKSVPKKYKTAIIFGIENYEKSPMATYANLDAKYFYEYARKGFGVSKQNIKLLIDNDAKLTNTFVTLEKWLPPKIKKNQTDLLIFFAGHGLASSNGEELYILPQDSDPDLLRRTALSRKELFDIILALEPKSVTMFFDTCYSGVSREEQTLLADARPIRLKLEDQSDIPKNFTIFSASGLDQISSGLKEAKHGIFSYYVMKGLEGNADINSDRKITNGELLSYLNDHVPLKASELGRKQTPSLAGDPDKILMRY